MFRSLRVSNENCGRSQKETEFFLTLNRDDVRSSLILVAFETFLQPSELPAMVSSRLFTSRPISELHRLMDVP